MNTRKTTIKDIAQEAGVSISLVSFVMNNRAKANGQGQVYRVNEETASKIKAVAERLNYQPNSAARSLRSGKTRTIGVVVSDISNKFFADIARIIEDAAYQSDYTVFFGSSDENPCKLDKIVSVLINRGVDGLIIVPCEKSDTTIRKVLDADIPLVLLDRTLPNTEIDCVVLNNKKAEYMSTESLLNKGIKKIEMISYAMRLNNIQDREAGYRLAMTEAGLESDICIHNIKYKDIPGQMTQVFDDILSRNVEGIVFATNTLTIEGVKCIKRKRPDHLTQIAIVGFDQSDAFDLSEYRIPYVKQPIELFGTESVRILLDNIAKHKQQTTTTTLNPQLIDVE